MKSLLASAALALTLTTGFSGVSSAADAYKFDASHAQILFSYDHLGFSTTYGLISGFDGEASIDKDSLENSSVNLEISLKDLMSTGWKARDDHFLSADFFNAAETPMVTFTSTSVEPTGDDTANITGDLTIAGTTKEIVLDAKLNKIAEHPMANKPWAGFNATTTLKRSDFGVEKFTPFVSDEVAITISVEMEQLPSS